tara:strand:+ start:425 stop:673 length:249 start_codon:yes stop_codon:yes gene_type:complete
MVDRIDEAKSILKSLTEDPNVPKGIKVKIKKAVESLNENDKDVGVRVNQALQDLDEVADDPSTPSLTRTQIWNVVSALEQKA